MTSPLSRRRGIDPFFNQLSRVQDEMNRVFGDLIGVEPESRRFNPPLDISENAEAFIVKTELPGVDPNDVQMNLHGTTLTISGEKTQENEQSGASFHRIERIHGAFQRSVQLPETIDPEKVRAKADNGVLTIEIGKKEASQPRQIKINQA